MNSYTAEQAVTGSALVVGGIYIYRRLSEVDVQLTNAHGLRLKQLAGAGPVLPAGPFVVGWGFTFLVLSLVAQVNPNLGGNFAILVALGAVLGNGENVFGDINTQLGGSSAKAGAGDASLGALVADPASVPTSHKYPGAVVVPQGFTVAPTMTH